MTVFTKLERLSDAELDRLGNFLKSCKGGKAMNIEEMDGFFAALIAGPEVVMPSEYSPEVFGGEVSEVCEFATAEQAEEIFGLMIRHWNLIAGTLFNREVYVPLVLEDENGEARGNDWARGFMRGMDMRHDGWATLVNDDENGGCLIPVMMLYHENDEDPGLRPKPIAPEKREDLILHMGVGLVGAYRYFRRRETHKQKTVTPRPGRTTSKARSNDPCPCGSGKKYKKCCGALKVN